MTFRQKRQYRRYKKAVRNINKHFLSQMFYVCGIDVELDEPKDNMTKLRWKYKDFSYESDIDLNIKIKTKDIENYIYDTITSLYVWGDI